VTQGPTGLTQQQYAGTFTWNSQAVPAADGELRSDSRNWSGAAELSFGTHDNTGTDATRLWQAMQAGDTIGLVQANNTTNWSDYALTGAPQAQGDGSWLMPVTRSGGTGQASNGQNCAVTFTVTTTEALATSRDCNGHDVAGFTQHAQPVRLFVDQMSAGQTFPEMYWCQWCHAVFVKTGEES